VTSVFEASGLALGYGRRVVLEEIALRIAPGELWFLVGPNGAGKSTLLNAFAGVLRPLRGMLRVSPEHASPARVGVVPQRCDLNPALPTTVREFVGLGLAGIRASRRERRERLAWALERVGLGGGERRDYWSLSGGQRQRALVARALVRRPRVLLLDEPTAGFDLTAGERLIEAIVDLNRTAGLTVVFVTHHLELALRHGSHFALCGGGRVSSGSAREVFSADSLRRLYGPSVSVAEDASGRLVVRVEVAEAS
jgi:ABC-type Mn2+/Zn2+ transport system ATPase subunit